MDIKEDFENFMYKKSKFVEDVLREKNSTQCLAVDRLLQEQLR